MRIAPDHLIYESAHRGNILPLTSVCNVSCVFCSHRQNPPGTMVYKIPPLPRERVKETLLFLSSAERIVIGESVTRICEGEPFTHPHIREILIMVREHFPTTEIRITTNGTLIGPEMAGFLGSLGNVKINLSLNSSSPGVRARLMKDPLAGTAVKAAACLADAGVVFHGSVVAMPHLNGWADLAQSIRYLGRNGAVTARIFLPGFTRLAPPSLRFAPGLWRQLADFAGLIAGEAGLPVTLEPPLIADLKAEVRGVIRDSPAARAGMRAGDIIVAVDGRRCFSRVAAFAAVKAAGPRTQVEIERQGTRIPLVIRKKPGGFSGLVMDYDIDPAQVARITETAGKYRRVRLLCSELGEPVLRQALLAVSADRETNIEIIPVQSRFFGGSIRAAGLLVVADFLAALRLSGDQKVSAPAGPGRDAVFLPETAFDREGRDLTGSSCFAVEEETGSKVEIL